MAESNCIHNLKELTAVEGSSRKRMTSVTALQPGRVNPDIRVKWVTFSPGQVGPRVKLKKSGFIILSNIVVINNTSDCSIREYRSIYYRKFLKFSTDRTVRIFTEFNEGTVLS